MKNLLTIIIVSFHSENIIENAIKSINRKKYKILVIDNANSLNLKKKLEDKYKNITVLNSKENLGFGRSINLAIKKIKTPFSFYLSADAILKEKSLEHILDYAVKNDDWIILTPSIFNTPTSKINIIKKNYKKDIDSINFTQGCAFFFDNKVIKKIGGFDENIFLYYEDNDFFFRCLKKNKILVINKALVFHKGNSSVDKKFNYEIELNRNWHLMWSKFYFYKKNFSIITAYKKTLRSFFSSLIKIIYYKFINKKKYFIYLNRFNGLLSSYMNKKSSRRPKID
jgi:N-acetylglucosaminyl-diphospho-decaprenol L-rhamnosyltransferase